MEAYKSTFLTCIDNLEEQKSGTRALTPCLKKKLSKNDFYYGYSKRQSSVESYKNLNSTNLTALDIQHPYSST